MARQGDTTTLVLGRDRIKRLQETQKATGISQSFWLRELIDKHLARTVSSVLKRRAAEAAKAVEAATKKRKQ